MGLHHDGEVDAFWLQLEGRRTVTIGPRVRPGTPEELDEGLARGDRRAGWRTFDLEPGTLFHLPCPHATRRRLPPPVAGRHAHVGARGRAAAERATRPPAGADGSLAWDVVSGFAEPIPPVHSAHALGAGAARRPPPRPRAPTLRVWTPDGEGPRLPARAAAWTAGSPQCRGSRARSRPGPASSR